MADIVKEYRAASKANLSISLIKNRDGSINIRNGLFHAFLRFLVYKMQGRVMDDKTGEEFRC